MPNTVQTVAPKLFTVGYEGRALDEMIAELVRAGVERLVDVRELPLSRRRGFSKTALGESLRGAGIATEFNRLFLERERRTKAGPPG